MTLDAILKQCTNAIQVGPQGDIIRVKLIGIYIAGSGGGRRQAIMETKADLFSGEFRGTDFGEM